MSSTRMHRTAVIAATAAGAVVAFAAYPETVTTVYQYDQIGNLTRILDVSSDATNCGGLGAACSTSHIAAVCTNGDCASGTCAAGYLDCNGDKRVDGCETVSNASNCGACGKVCATGYVCSAGSCVCYPKTCASIGASCGSYTNGCGGTISCGSCPTGYFCDGGACVYATPEEPPCTGRLCF